ncbi:MAG: GNAT family protein [Ignavibacteriae bacterium]|nr:GNAT family protein [Ignavibacteriota bacterium]
MEYSKQLIGEKCYLSPLETADAEKVAKWLNDLKVQMNFDLVFSITADEERYYIPELKKFARVFGIIDKESNNVIGVTGLHEIDHISRRAMLGIFIGDEEYRGKGFGTDAVNLTLDFGFNMLNLNSIALYVIEFNKGAMKVYEKCGFKYAGRKRQSKILGDEKFDMILMDILADEFKSVYVKNILNILKK